jgi:type I restriction-modification system DNA methylase subunit
MPGKSKTISPDSSANIGFEAKLWLAADNLRNNMDVVEYKHVVLAIMNQALRGIEADFGPENADTFSCNRHLDLRADYVLTTPPFNDSDWFWRYN